MLSGKLVKSIQDHWEEIAAVVLRKIRRHPDTEVLARQTDAELRDWCRDILENLNHWLVARDEQEVKRRYELAGGLRFEEAIPLHEAVLRFQMLKDAIIDFARGQALPSYVQLYAEEELESRVTRFFDTLVYHVVVGYERAMRRSARYV